MTSPQTILAFDIGIRNLAWCCMTKSNASDPPHYTIQGWQNVDLLSSTEGPATKIVCTKCSAKASHQSGSLYSCGRHCPSDRPALRDISGAVLKKIPSQAEVKVLLTQKGLLPLPKTRQATFEKLAEHFSLPLEQKKKKKAVDTELSILHEAIRGMVQQNLALFRTATAIHLENQPVLKNPTMKTVQILLYATLRDLLSPSPPPLRLIHAGVKVKGKQTGDKGYKERKQGSEEKAAELFKEGKILEAQRWQSYLASHTKRNDLTDAFCMCMDGLS